ncbi:MAG TPA: hypothetical protein PKY82_21045 [Pyrinomonadaceae bacterium]|nr:hypothetical protein [Pyrinomonadaceae bacterium]
MSEHLSPEKIKLFLEDKLSADEAVEVLLHLNNCQECHKLAPEKKPEEILEIFFREDKEGEGDSESLEKLEETK